MVDFSLNLCYGIIVSSEKMEEIQEALTDSEYDEVLDNYSRCVNSWTGEDYFIGFMTNVSNSTIDYVYNVSDFSAPADNDEDWIDFKRFFDEHDLWQLIDWKPELLLINFCF